MKIKDIVHEGFISALMPKTLANTLQTLKKTKRPLSAKARTELEPEYLNLAKAAHSKYGDAPGKEGMGAIGWLTDEQRKQLEKETGPSSPEPSAPAAPPITHPDVTVTSSYPLRLRYKSGDYVLDPTTNQWRTVSGKRVAPELASFLQYQASKL